MEGYFESVGDFEIAIPNVAEKVQLSEKGKKKIVTIKDVDEDLLGIAKTMEEVGEKIPDKLVYECPSCGNQIESFKEPYMCPCGSKNFELKSFREGEEVEIGDKKAIQGDFEILFSIRSGQLEIWYGKTKLVFEDVFEQPERLKKVLKEVSNCLEEARSRYDLDEIEQGLEASKRHDFGKIKDIIGKESMNKKKVINEAKEKGIENPKQALKKMENEGEIFEVEQGVIKVL